MFFWLKKLKSSTKIKTYFEKTKLKTTPLLVINTYKTNEMPASWEFHKTIQHSKIFLCTFYQLRVFADVVLNNYLLYIRVNT